MKSKILAALLVLLALVAVSCGTENEPVEEAKKLTHTYSGVARPVVVDNKQYMNTAAEDTAQAGKIVYSVNNSNAGELIGETNQTAGVPSTEITAQAKIGYKFVRWSDGVTAATRSGDTKEGVYTAIFDYEVLDLPIIVIETENGQEITSKDEYIGATISVIACENVYVIDSAPMQIRGRGNFSWSFDKKSYKFKLDVKENLFGIGNGEERIWVLLSNHCDQSLLRNHVSMELGRSLDGIAWEPASVSVDVYLNGDFIGVYLLAEEIKISENRVNITAVDPDAIDTGYLLEMSNYAERGGIHTARRAHNIHTELSLDENIRNEQKQYIKSYVDTAYETMKEGDYEKVVEYIDLESFISAYLLQEVVKNLDSHHDNFYVWKDVDTNLNFGPYWDFDLSLGNANEGAEEYTGIYVGNGYGSDKSTINWFAISMMHEWYRQMVVDEWDEIYEELLLLPDYIKAEAEAGFRSYERNFERWPIFGTVQNRETEYITSLENYTEHYTYLAEWLTNRIEWLNEAFHDEEFVTKGKGIAKMEKLLAQQAEESMWAEMEAQTEAESD